MDSSIRAEIFDVTCERERESQRAHRSTHIEWIPEAFLIYFAISRSDSHFRMGDSLCMAFLSHIIICPLPHRTISSSVILFKILRARLSILVVRCHTQTHTHTNEWNDRTSWGCNQSTQWKSNKTNGSNLYRRDEMDRTPKSNYMFCSVVHYILHFRKTIYSSALLAHSKKYFLLYCT